MIARTSIVNDLVVPYASPTASVDAESQTPTGERLPPVTLPVGGLTRPNVLEIPAADLVPGDVILVGPRRSRETVEIVAHRMDGKVAVRTTVARRVHAAGELVAVPRG